MSNRRAVVACWREAMRGRSKTNADLERARRQLTWVSDDDLDEVEARSTWGTTLLGLFTWGGGRFMVGDRKGGAVGIAALIGWMAASQAVPSAVGAMVYWGLGAVFATWSYDSSRKVRRFEKVRNQIALQEGPGPGAYRLLAAASAADPTLAAALPALAIPASASPASGPHAPMIEKLRQMMLLHRSGVLSDAELNERKVDLFAAAPPASRGELDELLFALLPLRDEGAISDDDIAFLKGLAR
jgi:hypothetical protein